LVPLVLICEFIILKADIYVDLDATKASVAG
jgi:hypothetical protein